MDDGSFTILIPTDNAFQRWHPIDWGFYPFSVQEFTESVLRNHFLPMQKPLRMADVKNMDQMAVRTMGGESVVFRGQRKYFKVGVRKVLTLKESFNMEEVNLCTVVQGLREETVLYEARNNLNNLLSKKRKIFKF